MVYFFFRQLFSVQLLIPPRCKELKFFVAEGCLKPHSAKHPVPERTRLTKNILRGADSSVTFQFKAIVLASVAHCWNVKPSFFLPHKDKALHLVSFNRIPPTSLELHLT